MLLGIILAQIKRSSVTIFDLEIYRFIQCSSIECLPFQRSMMLLPL